MSAVRGPLRGLPWHPQFLTASSLLDGLAICLKRFTRLLACRLGGIQQIAAGLDGKPSEPLNGCKEERTRGMAQEFITQRSSALDLGFDPRAIFLTKCSPVKTFNERSHAAGEVLETLQVLFRLVRILALRTPLTRGDGGDRISVLAVVDVSVERYTGDDD